MRESGVSSRTSVPHAATNANATRTKSLFMDALLESRDERRGVIAAPAVLRYLVVVPEHGLRDRQLRAVAARLREADAEILAHPVHREAEVELARVHRLAAVLHLPRLRGALRDHVEDLLDVE